MEKVGSFSLGFCLVGLWICRRVSRFVNGHDEGSVVVSFDAGSWI